MSGPVFGFLVFSDGSFSGAVIRDISLANSLHQRGYGVVIYWLLSCNRNLVSAGIRQRILGIETPERDSTRTDAQTVDGFMESFCRKVCDGGESDPALVTRLLKYMEKDGVTHLLPTFAMTCPIALAAKVRGTYPFEYLVTFQGEELFANFAQRIDRLGDYYRRLSEVVAGSSWPAVAVSRDYARRVRDEMGIDESRLRVIYPGIGLQRPDAASFEELRSIFPNLIRESPIVSYVGRQDSEKGVDLLLYAAKILVEKGRKLQLVICGSICFGDRYREVIKQIAGHLRLDIHHASDVPDRIRDGLYRHSRCLVYPSIHLEPFGLVVAEAMSHGTPVLVPDRGGITEAIECGGMAGGLKFEAWNSGDLARQLERLLTDETLYRDLAANTRNVAASFTIDRMTDETLRHMGIGVSLMR